MNILDLFFKDIDKIRFERLNELLVSQGLQFKEMGSRMSYGLIGHLIHKRTGEISIIVFPSTFYVSDNDLSINKYTLEIIRLVRGLYVDLSRDEKNKIIPVTLN